jgi:trimethylamine--corrinoid protein Co-methyltransferase
MLDMVAGGEGEFAKRPFVSIGGCPIVSPLTYGVENSELCVQGAAKGMVVTGIMAPQAGATAPAALAGTLVQVTAEALAGLLLVGLVHRGHPVLFGTWPLVSDLRTGAFSGGGGEQALLGAAAVQIAGFYGIPSSSGAGMTDSKTIDAQAGIEKSITTVVSALAGGNWLDEVCGMQASLMGCSFEAMVVDDEMLGVIQRVLRGIEVTDETLSYHVIDEIVDGPRHFLGHPQTLALMQTEYAYPSLADRSTPDVWEESGALDMRARARERVRKILSEHYPRYIDDALDAKLREHFPIRLPREAMRADCGRW